MNPPRLLIRTDASPTIGIGHVMRCLALAQAWQDNGGIVRFLCLNVHESISRRLLDEGCEVVSIPGDPGRPSTDRLYSEVLGWHTDWVAVDGYELGAAVPQLTQNGLKVLAIDDFGGMGTQQATLHLDQNLGTGISSYPEGRSLLGLRYALLRREFRNLSPRVEAPDIARRLLITAGGGDSIEAIRSLTQALEPASWDLDGTLILGPGGIQDPDLGAFLGKSHHRWVTCTAPPSMASLMQSADIALSAAGSTCWELCRAGLPSALLPLVQNQVPVAKAMADNGAAINLEQLTEKKLTEALIRLIGDPDRRRRMSLAGQALVDGNGAPRVVNAMLGKFLALRPASLDDSHWLWELANESLVRSQSICMDHIPWEVHEAWLQARMTSPDSQLWIASDADGQRVGQLRLDQHAGFAEVSYSLMASARGRGLGTALLARALPTAKRWKGLPIEGSVRTENEASIKAFLSNGYRLVGESFQSGRRLLRFRGGD